MRVLLCVALIVALTVFSGDAAKLRKRRDIRLSKDPLKYLLDFIKLHSSKIQHDHATRQNVADGECTRKVNAKVYTHNAPEWFNSYLHGCDKRSQCFNETSHFANEGRIAASCIKEAAKTRNSSSAELASIEKRLMAIVETHNKAESALQAEKQKQTAIILEHNNSIVQIKQIMQMIREHYEKTPEKMSTNATEILETSLVEIGVKPMRKEMRELFVVFEQLISSWKQLNQKAENHISIATDYFMSLQSNNTKQMNKLRSRRDLIEERNVELESKVPECKSTLKEMEKRFVEESNYCAKIHKSYVQTYNDNKRMITLSDKIHDILKSHIGSRAHKALKRAAKHAQKKLLVPTGPASTGATGTASTGATGPTSTGVTGPTSTGATGPTETGTTGPTASGATGSTSTGATGPIATGATGPASIVATGPTSTGNAGATGATMVPPPPPSMPTGPMGTMKAGLPTGIASSVSDATGTTLLNANSLVSRNLLSLKNIDKMWKNVLERFDTNEDKEISLDEVEQIYTNVPYEAKAYLRQYVKSVFTQLDINKDGKVSSREVVLFIKKHFLPSAEKSALAGMAKEFKEKDHMHISREEFGNIMNKYGATNVDKAFSLFKGDDNSVDTAKVTSFSRTDQS